MSRRRKRNYQRNHPCWVYPVKMVRSKFGIRVLLDARNRRLRTANRRGRRLAF